MIERIFADRAREIFEIMEKSFPLTEYRTEAEQAALFEKPYYRVFAHTEGGRAIGFIAVWQFPALTFIEHLATLPEARNRGIGAELVSFICSSSEQVVCLEVEPPEDELTRRRVGFYERCGMHLNGYPYIQPSISAGREPIPLRIMTSGREVGASEYEDIRDLLYREVYGVKTTD